MPAYSTPAAHGSTTTIIEHHYVYYDTTDRIYFYQVGGVWKSGRAAPATIKINSGEGVSLKLRGNNPTIYFDEHRVKFGSGSPGHGGPDVRVTGPDHDQGGGGGKEKGHGKRKW